MARRTVAEWDREGLRDFARVSDRPVVYDVARAWKWRFFNKPLVEEPSENGDRQSARQRKEAAQARLAELELAERERRLIRIEHLDEVVRKILKRVNVVLHMLPARCGPRLVGLTTPREGIELLGSEVEVAYAGLLELADELEAEAERAADEDIPDDFPGRRALAGAGIETFRDLAELEDLTDVKGVGPKTAAAITALLEARNGE